MNLRDLSPTNTGFRDVHRYDGTTYSESKSSGRNVTTARLDVSLINSTYVDNGVVRPSSILHRVKTRFT